MQVREEQLLKALSDMEAVAKGSDVSPGMSGKGNKIPTTTSQANGGLSGEGDQSELSVTSSSPAYAAKGAGGEDEEFDFDQLDDDDTSKAVKGKGKTLAQWAKEEAAEEAHKSEDEDEDDESMDEDEDEDVEKCSRTKKSTIADIIKSETSTGPIIDVAPFIETLVDQVSDSDQEVKKALLQLAKQQNSQRRVLKAMGNLMLELRKGMGQVLNAPATVRKSVLSEADLDDVHSQERFRQTGMDFSKSDVLDAMVELAQAGRINTIDVSRYETTNTMEKDVRKAVEDHLRKSA